MIRKYFNRFALWGFLIAGLITLSFYGRQWVLKPMDNEIVKLQKEQQTLNNNVLFLQTQINRYTSVYFDNEEINQMIPKGYNELEVEQKYVQRPIQVDYVDGILKNYTIVNKAKPSQLKLSNSIEGIKVSATVEFGSQEQIFRYLEELQNSFRLIYIDSLNYNLPGETQINNPDYIYKLEIQYFLFYYPNSN